MEDELAECKEEDGALKDHSVEHENHSPNLQDFWFHVCFPCVCSSLWYIKSSSIYIYTHWYTSHPFMPPRDFLVGRPDFCCGIDSSFVGFGPIRGLRNLLVYPLVN